MRRKTKSFPTFAPCPRLSTCPRPMLSKPMPRRLIDAGVNIDEANTTAKKLAEQSQSDTRKATYEKNEARLLSRFKHSRSLRIRPEPTLPCTDVSTHRTRLASPHLLLWAVPKEILTRPNYRRQDRRH